MARLVFAEFDQFVEALSGLQGQYVLRAKQVRDWRLRSIDLNGITLMTGREGAARICQGTGLAGCFHIGMLLSGDQCVVVDGKPFDRKQLAWIAPQRLFHASTSQPISWLNITVSSALVLQWVEAHPDEFDFSLLDHSRTGVAHRSLTAVISLAERLFQMDAQSPAKLHTPIAEHAARMEVLDAVFTSLPVNTCTGSQRSSNHNLQMLQRALGVLETLDDKVICTADLCAAVGASERTVRNLFNHFLGMSPHRYLMLRRLHAIRDAIRHADPVDTITSICARYGVWDFGRLARQYSDYFGVLPSQALHGLNHRPRFDSVFDGRGLPCSRYGAGAA